MRLVNVLKKNYFILQKFGQNSNKFAQTSLKDLSIVPGPNGMKFSISITILYRIYPKYDSGHPSLRFLSNDWKYEPWY